MKQHQQTRNTQPAMQAKLKWGNQREREFTTDAIDTDVSNGNRSFFAIQYTEGSDTAYSYIFLNIPERYLVAGASLKIGAGEKAEINAYFGSTSIGRSGWATGGSIDITEMDEASKAFAATFHYTIEHTMGMVEIVDGSLSLSLAKDARTNGTGQVTANLDPAIFPSLGNLDAQTIESKILQDGRIQLIARQQVDNAIQGIMMLFSEQHARLFFSIGGMHYLLSGGRLQHEWNVDKKTLTADFTDYVVSYQGRDHRITDGRIEVTLA
ncbi:hypothetical protein QR297_15240 [Pseudomonas shirazica]|jgi:hypothetical protein|uniref:Uncharacterized protein n=1 Tax=Pseudomonas shirazica TaxID=1940636 RepID=A0ABY9SIH2_9PSED|nr:hypothetical protein [Pseudomonas shirazica]WMY83336.1 hypothetical protein QR297_15240 [Pseudomonas shirazica]